MTTPQFRKLTYTAQQVARLLAIPPQEVDNLEARGSGALEALADAIRDVESLLGEMRADHDALAAHIFVARRLYRQIQDTKSGRRRETSARLSPERACELG